MFTGLIEATGKIVDVQDTAGGRRLRVATPLAGELRPGDSIATNGVCLTVTERDGKSFSVDLSPETLRVTALASMSSGRTVNLERPLRADARLGGHFVLGHVDGVGRVRSVQAQGEHHWLEVEFPSSLAPLLIPKGSVSVDGISLTVASLAADSFGVQVIAFTWTHTALASLKAGEAVNLEGDVLGKYVVRLLELQGDRVKSGSTS
jgi:riboflavin synthase